MPPKENSSKDIDCYAEIAAIPIYVTNYIWNETIQTMVRYFNKKVLLYKEEVHLKDILDSLCIDVESQKKIGSLKLNGPIRCSITNHLENGKRKVVLYMSKKINKKVVELNE